MNIDLSPYFFFAIVLVLVVLALAVWRKVVSSHEDDTLHVLADSSVVTQQTRVAHKLDVIDRWGKLLTVVTTLYVLVIFVLFAYQRWVSLGSAR